MRTKKTSRTDNTSVQQYSLVVYSRKDLKNLLDYGVKRYAYIYHDKDINEDGTPKEPHYHLFLSFIRPRRKLWLDTFRLFHKTNENIMCEPCKDVSGLIVYFTHIKEPKKTQYLFKKIKSNFNIEFSEEIENQNQDLFNSLHDIANDGGIGWTNLFHKNPKLIYSSHSVSKAVDLMQQENAIIQANQKNKELHKSIEEMNDYINKQQEKIKNLKRQVVQYGIMFEHGYDYPTFEEIKK